jgi:ribosomal protein L5
MTRVAKVIELVGVRIKDGRKQRKWLDEAAKTIRDITGITASVDPNTNKIKEYKVGVKIAFGVEH